MKTLEKQIVTIIENNSPELAAEEILRLFDVVWQSEQLVCDNCKGWGYTVDENGRRKEHCTKCE